MRPVDPWHRVLHLVAAPAAGWNSAGTSHAATLAVALVSTGFLVSIAPVLREPEIMGTLLFFDILAPTVLLSGLWIWGRRRRIANSVGAAS